MKNLVIFKFIILKKIKLYFKNFILIICHQFILIICKKKEINI